jgi:UDP-N-acetylmuramate-alanine ligase
MLLRETQRCHLVGVAGAGMSALAQFHATGGVQVTGSDRLFDTGRSLDLRRRLDAAGVTITPQDGSGVVQGLDCVVFSTAVETDNPDLTRARELGLPIVHRSDCLSAIVSAHKTVVIAGTSGKSTVAAMLWEILSLALGRVSVISGGPILRLRDEGLVGNAFNARSDLLVVEGDESDGTLVKYDAPYLSVLLNMSKDHKELDELSAIFGDFLRRSSSICIDADADNVSQFRLPAFYRTLPHMPDIHTFGFTRGDLRAEDIELGPWDSRFRVDGIRCTLPVPGAHNVFNATAAMSAACAVGVSLETAATALASFRGVFRRLQVVGECRGVRVIDDFAHNPAKILAAMAAAQLGARRLLTIYQPHGVFPTKFLKRELIEAFRESLRPEDKLWLPDIYTVGAVDTSISSADIAVPLVEAGCHARHVATWDAIAREIAAEARPGDVVLVMGARDPELPARAQSVLDAICA